VTHSELLNVLPKSKIKAMSDIQKRQQTSAFFVFDRFRRELHLPNDFDNSGWVR